MNCLTNGAPPKDAAYNSLAVQHAIICDLKVPNLEVGNLRAQDIDADTITVNTITADTYNNLPIPPPPIIPNCARTFDAYVVAVPECDNEFATLLEAFDSGAESVCVKIPVTAPSVYNFGSSIFILLEDVLTVTAPTTWTSSFAFRMESSTGFANLNQDFTLNIASTIIIQNMDIFSAAASTVLVNGGGFINNVRFLSGCSVAVTNAVSNSFITNCYTNNLTATVGSNMLVLRNNYATGNIFVTSDGNPIQNAYIVSNVATSVTLGNAFATISRCWIANNQAPIITVPGATDISQSHFTDNEGNITITSTNISSLNITGNDSVTLSGSLGRVNVTNNIKDGIVTLPTTGVHRNCTISNNGLVDAAAGTATYIDCDFLTNRGVTFSNSATQCRFVGNDSGLFAGGGFIMGTVPGNVFSLCSFENNNIRMVLGQTQGGTYNNCQWQNNIVPSGTALVFTNPMTRPIISDNMFNVAVTLPDLSLSGVVSGNYFSLTCTTAAMDSVSFTGNTIITTCTVGPMTFSTFTGNDVNVLNFTGANFRSTISSNSVVTSMTFSLATGLCAISENDCGPITFVVKPGSCPITGNLIQGALTCPATGDNGNILTGNIAGLGYVGWDPAEFPPAVNR